MQIIYSSTAPDSKYILYQHHKLIASQMRVLIQMVLSAYDAFDAGLLSFKDVVLPEEIPKPIWLKKGLREFVN